MAYKKKTISLLVIAGLLAELYVFYDLSGNISYILPRRIIKVLAIILTEGSIAFSTTIFMTITDNRTLTPSVMGLDSLYLLIQTLIIFLFGSQSFVMMYSHMNYMISIGAMVLFSLVLYQFLFKGEQNNIYFLLLFGILLVSFFFSFMSFLHELIDIN